MRAVALSLIVLLPTPAFAHPGHEDAGIASGLLHPLTGMDHMAAMVMVGLWAGLIGGRAAWMVPAAFLAAMAAGFGYGMEGSAGLPVDSGIILSLLILGAALVLRLRAPLTLAAGATALFGFVHGLAHGMETPIGQPWLGFATGFLFTTAALHGAGLLLARHIPALRPRAA